MATTYSKGRVYRIPLTDIEADPGQPRKYVDPGALSELATSIAKFGVLEPILFRRGEDGKLLVVAGERRPERSRSAGRTDIPGIFVDGNHREISLIENLLRQDLTPMEEAEGMQQVMNECGYNQNQLSEMIGKSQPAISQVLSLNTLPTDVKNSCRTNPNIPKAVLFEVAAAKSESLMRRKFERWMAKEATKTQAPKPTRPTVSKTRTFLLRMDDLHADLVELAWQNWPVEEQQDLVGLLRDMRGTTNEILALMAEQGLDTGDEKVEVAGDLR